MAEGTPKAIEMKGITRNATKIGVQDGQAEDLINLRFMDGSWRASGDGRLINFTMNRTYTQLYVHTNVYHHLLGVYEGTLYWFANIDEDGVTFTPLETPKTICEIGGDIICVTQNGHLITIVVDNDDIIYVVYKTSNESYVKIVTDSNDSASSRKIYPYGGVHFNFETDDTDDYQYKDHDNEQSIVADKTDIDFQASTCIYSDSDSEEDKNAKKLIWHSKMLKVFNDALEDNRFTDPFLVLLAVKLYDGSYVFASNPVLINPRDKDRLNDMHLGQYIADETTEVIDDNGMGSTHEFYVYFTYKDSLKIKAVDEIEHIQHLPTYTSCTSQTHLYVGGGLGQGFYTDNPWQPLNDDDYPASLFDFSWMDKYNMDTIVRGADLVVSIDDISLIEENSDVFTGIGIFVTQQARIFEMSEEGHKDGTVVLNWDKKDGIYEYHSAFGQKTISTTVANATYAPPVHTNDKIIYDLINSPFFLLRDYNINELKQLTKGAKVDLTLPQYENLLKNLVEQKRLTTETLSRTRYIPKTAYSYNNRLHIANYKAYPYFGYPIDMFQLHNHSVSVYQGGWFPDNVDRSRALANLVNHNDDYWQQTKSRHYIAHYPDMVAAAAPYFLIKVYIDSSQGEQVVCRYIQAYDPNNPLVNGRADFVEDLNPILSFPDARANKMEIYYVENYKATGGVYDPAGVYVRFKSFDLKPHPYLNLAYYIDPELKPIKLSSFGTWNPYTQQGNNQEPLTPVGGGTQGVE